MLPRYELLISASVTGISCHLFYFIRGEHHLEAAALFRLMVSSPAISFFSQILLGRITLVAALTNTIFMLAAFHAALFISMTIYRMFFHPIKSFPGPVGAKVSKLWHVSHLVKTNNFRLLDNLHVTYGDYVRTGQ